MVEKLSIFFAEQLAQLVFLVTAEFKFLSSSHHHSVVPVEPWLDFADALEIDDGGAMDAHKPLRIELRFHLIHVAADQMRCCTAVEAQIVAFSFNPVQVADVEEKEAPF